MARLSGYRLHPEYPVLIKEYGNLSYILFIMAMALFFFPFFSLVRQEFPIL